MEDRFTEAELAIAKSVDLTAVASYLGYTVKKVGHYHTLKEMDSIRIYDKSHWFRWSRQYDKGENGGSQIDFLRVFCGMEVKEAVWWLLDFAGYRRIEEKDRKPPLKYQVEPGRKPEPSKTCWSFCGASSILASKRGYVPGSRPLNFTLRCRV